MFISTTIYNKSILASFSSRFLLNIVSGCRNSPPVPVCTPGLDSAVLLIANCIHLTSRTSDVYEKVAWGERKGPQWSVSVHVCRVVIGPYEFVTSSECRSEQPSASPATLTSGQQTKKTPKNSCCWFIKDSQCMPLYLQLLFCIFSICRTSALLTHLWANWATYTVQFFMQTKITKLDRRYKLRMCSLRTGHRVTWWWYQAWRPSSFHTWQSALTNWHTLHWISPAPLWQRPL